MDSTINLLPEKDKQLKRDGKPKTPSAFVEMTKPQDRIFQERVVRVGGVLDFFKTLFKRKPKVLAKPKVVPIPPPLPAIPSPKLAHQSTQVTKLETMQDRLPKPVVPPVPKAPLPPPAPPGTGFFSRLFSKPKKRIPPPPARPVITVPPVPRPAVPVAPPVPPVRHQPMWAPPPPPPHATPATPPPQPMPAKPVPPLAPVPIPSPVRKPAPVVPAAPVTDVGQAVSRTGTLGGLQVNLVPEEFKPESSPRDRLYALIAVGGAVLLVAAATFGLLIYKHSLQSKVAILQQDIDTVHAQVAQAEQPTLNDAVVIQNRTANIRTVLDQHIYWDAFFQKLEDVTLPSVTYTTMSADVSGTISLAAIAASFDDVGNQLLAYKQAKDFITDVSITSATRSQQQAPTAGQTPSGSQGQTRSVVSFSVSLHVTPKIFFQTP